MKVTLSLRSLYDCHNNNNINNNNNNNIIIIIAFFFFFFFLLGEGVTSLTPICNLRKQKHVGKHFTNFAFAVLSINLWIDNRTIAHDSVGPALYLTCAFGNKSIARKYAYSDCFAFIT